MKSSLKIKPLRIWPAGAVLLLFFIVGTSSFAFERYKNDAEDDGSNCSECHGNFTDATSQKGSIFPSGDKHEMHRNSSYMNADCDLCHSNGDSRNPYMDFSNGASGVGLGCNGCHNAVGLRAHHAANGVSDCAGCHPGDSAPPAESLKPPYY